MTKIEEFFQHYEAGANSFDPDLVASQFHESFMAGGPGGVACLQNDSQFRNAIPKREAFFQQLGFKSAKILGLVETPIDECYTNVKVHWHMIDHPIITTWENQTKFDAQTMEFVTGTILDILLPQYVLGYSSGGNEILSLPFFKTRFIQYDEYWNALIRQDLYTGPATRLAYLDSSFSQAILLCNLLFQDEAILKPFREDVGIETLKEFRIILRRKISIDVAQLEAFDTSSEDQQKERTNRTRVEYPRATDSELQDFIRREIVKSNSALHAEEDEYGTTRYYLNLLQLLEEDETENDKGEENKKGSSRMIDRPYHQ